MAIGNGNPKALTPICKYTVQYNTIHSKSTILQSLEIVKCKIPWFSLPRVFQKVFICYSYQSELGISEEYYQFKIYHRRDNNA
jgi:hypothetical protein